VVREQGLEVRRQVQGLVSRSLSSRTFLNTAKQQYNTTYMLQRLREFGVRLFQVRQSSRFFELFLGSFFGGKHLGVCLVQFALTTATTFLMSTIQLTDFLNSKFNSKTILLVGNHKIIPYTKFEHTGIIRYGVMLRTIV